MLDFIDGLPEFVEYGGRRYGIKSDFRIWVQFEKILYSAELSVRDKAIEMIKLCYKDRLPPDIKTAIGLLMDFYCGGIKQEGSGRKRGRRVRLYDFSIDAELFYAAFLEQYRIDLTKDGLHWWKFLALFHSLSQHSRLVQVMRWRAADLSEIADKKQKEFYKKMKQLYRLPEWRSREEADSDLAEEIAQMIG